jgi:hypothetical protein
MIEAFWNQESLPRHRTIDEFPRGASDLPRPLAHGNDRRSFV